MHCEVPLHRLAAWVRCGVGMVGAAGLLAGCASPFAHKAAAPIFYPPAPDTPRLQYLTGFSSSDDVGERNRLLDFLIGKRPAKPIGKPYGVTTGHDRIYVGDTGPAAVEILDLEKHQMRYFAPRGAGRLTAPVNMVLDQDGSMYVADAGRGQVLIFGPDQALAGTLGARPAVNLPSFMGGVKAAEPAPAAEGGGQASDAMTPMKPTGLVLFGDWVYVADPPTHSVRVFDKHTHKQLRVVPADPKDERGKLYSPTNLAVDKQGRLYVSDIGGFCVQQFDAAGKYLQTFGRQGDRPGECIRPKGVAVDRDGRLYVVDAAAQVVQIFDGEAHLLMYFGEPNESEHALILPAGITIDYENVGRFQKYVAPGYQLEYLVVVISQFGASLVNVFGFLKPQ